MTESLVKEFLVESFEYLSTISEEITRLEKTPDDSELFNAIYRKFHTIKGSAGLLKFSKLQEITHSTENLLDVIRDGNIRLNSFIIDTLLSSVDAVSEILKSIEDNGRERVKDLSGVMEGLLGAIEKSVTPIKDEVIKDTHIPVTTIEEENFTFEGDTANKTINKGAGSEKETKPLPKIKTEGEKNMETSVKQSSPPAERNVVDSVVRVDVNLLDKMMNIVGELVLNRNQILQFSNSIELAELHRLSQQLDAITTELQSDIMTTRMQPIGGVLNKFERIVRDMARDLDKKVSLKIEGKDTELDKTLIEAIKDPMTHMVRNAVDHGIESPEKRKLAGKQEVGRINIKAYHEGGQVTIEIKDDGKGLSREQILNLAIQKGVVSQDAAARLNEKQVFGLIFSPGFSTAEKITNVSGRGVGMDVVKTNVEKIGGSVDLESVEGGGTTFKLKIPLTLAIVPALIIKGCGESFAIPQTNLVELVRLEGDKKITLVEKVQEAEFFRLRGELIPIIRLNNALRLSDTAVSDSALEQEHASKEDVLNIVILSADGRNYGLIVDTILDTEEIVVKPLSKQLRSLSVFAGATIMGDGQVALIIDAVGFASSLKLGLEKGLAKEKSLSTEGILSEESQEFLLVKLAAAGLYGVPLSLVNRLEEFPLEDIQYSGNQMIVRYRDVAMPLISVESALKLNKEGNGSKDSANKILPVFVLKVREHYYGFIVDEIIDIAVTDSEINSDVVDRDGLIGTIFVNDKTVTILDIYSIIGTRKIGSQRGQIQAAGAKRKENTILVVEDSPLYRKMSVDLLMGEGYNVLSAVDGQAGFELLSEKNDIELVISDIMMPRMDGLDLARTIRKEPKFNNIPLVALTTKMTESNVEEGKKAGFQYYLEKFNKVEILETVDRIFSGKVKEV